MARESVEKSRVRNFMFVLFWFEKEGDMCFGWRGLSF